ncbi:MAG: hypothetical protein QM211_07130, partial [Bacillota bacterium]|nr:hypothetical protein [Bacillota bacterium]
PSFFSYRFGTLAKWNKKNSTLFRISTTPSFFGYRFGTLAKWSRKNSTLFRISTTPSFSAIDLARL